MPTNDDTNQLVQMGIAAQIPGFQTAIDFLQAELNRMREQLAQLQNGHRTVAAMRQEIAEGLTKRSGKRVMSPEGRKSISQAQRKRWATQKEAQAEAQRSTKNQNLSAARKAHWAGMSKRRQNERLAKMLAGRRAKQGT